MSGQLELVLGGARSGKSRYAESLASGAGRVIYLATAAPLDGEMEERIALHRQRRPDSWETVEEPVRLSRVLEQAGDGFILIDCLTLWLTNCLFDPGVCWPDVRAEFLTALRDTAATVVMVSNEVGMGVIPEGEATRRFVDEAGLLHQDIAALAHRVTWVVAGIPVTIKPECDCHNTL